MNRALLGPLSLALLVASGCEDAPRGPEGGLDVAIAPLSLDGVADAVWDIAVVNGAGDPVWSQRVTASRYGDGVGSITYIGTCDASLGVATNTVSLRLLGLYAAPVAAPGAFGGPAPAGGLAHTSPGLLTRPIVCLENRDVAVRFDVTVIRPAVQGFFDIAVDFDDIFCSAKYDCSASELLHNPDTGRRGPTHVLAFSCLAGTEAGVDTALYLDSLLLTCGGASATIEPSGPAGIRRTSAGWTGVSFSGGFTGLFQVGVYKGDTYEDATPPLSGRYWTVALGVDRPLAGCTLSTQGTADDDAAPGGAQGGVVPAGVVYPRIVWSVPLDTCPTSHPLDVPPSGVTTDYIGPGEGFVGFDHRYPDVDPAPSTQWPAISASEVGRRAGFDAIGTDAAGNVYVAGHIGGPTTFGTHSLAPAPGDLVERFVGKLSPAAEWLWVTPIGGLPGVAANAFALAVAGDVYVVWHGASTTLGVSRVSPSGALVWNLAYTQSVDGTLVLRDLVVHGGRVYVAGALGGTVTLPTDPPTVLTSSSGFVENAFFGAIDAAAGTWIEARLDGAGAGTMAYAKGLALGPAGELYTTGAYRGAATFGALTLPGSGPVSDTFVARLSPLAGALTGGTWDWVATSSGGNSSGAAITFGQGMVAAAGDYRGAAVFGGDTLPPVGATTATWVASLTPAGAWTWTRTSAVPSAGAYNFAGSVAIDASGPVICGNASGDTGFGATTLSAAGLYGWVSRLDLAGNWQWARGFGSAQSQCSRVVLATTGDVFAAGFFKTAETYGTQTRTSIAQRDGLAVRLSPSGAWKP